MSEEEIKSRPFSEKGRENYDKIFAKKSAHEWLKIEDPQLRILDPDGWRHNDGVTMETKISYKDFLQRLKQCTSLGYIYDPEKKVIVAARS